MKNFIIAAVAATALNSVYAENCASNFSGFYAGIQAGMNSSHSTRTLGTEKDKARYGDQSILGGFYTGYGMGIGNCAYVGGEVYVNFHNTSIKYQDDTSDENIRGVLTPVERKHTAQNIFNIGGKVRFGYTLSPQAMIFLGLGIEYSPWKLKYTRKVGNASEKTVSGTKNMYAFTPSVGTDVFMTKNFFVRGEYTYVAPSMVKLKDDNGGMAKHNINQHRFVLGLGYKF